MELLSVVIKWAKSDFLQVDQRPNDALTLALACPYLDAEFVFELKPDLKKQRPNSAFLTGPTQQMIWGNSLTVYFLEIHNES